MEKIEGMLPSGEWITLAEWIASDESWDAYGWLDEFGNHVGSGTARLPAKGFVDLRHFIAVRAG